MNRATNAPTVADSCGSTSARRCLARDASGRFGVSTGGACSVVLGVGDVQARERDGWLC